MDGVSEIDKLEFASTTGLRAFVGVAEHVRQRRHGGPDPIQIVHPRLDARTGDIVVANADYNSVSLLDAASGRNVRTVPPGLPPRALAVDQRRDRVVVLTREQFVPAAPAGQVQVLDGRTGRLLHTAAVGADASALALDERTGKVFATA